MGAELKGYVYVYDAALYCGEHKPHEDAELWPDGGGEADCPQHCDTCGAFLRNPLTQDGYNYVAAEMERWEASEDGDFEVLDEWAYFYGIEWTEEKEYDRD